MGTRIYVHVRVSCYLFVREKRRLVSPLLPECFTEEDAPFQPARSLNFKQRKSKRPELFRCVPPESLPFSYAIIFNMLDSRLTHRACEASNFRQSKFEVTRIVVGRTNDGRTKIGAVVLTIRVPQVRIWTFITFY